MGYYSDMIHHQNAMFKELNSLNPDAIKGFNELKHDIIKDGALSAKIREIIAITLGVAAQCEPCIAFHAHACVRYGVTREELADALGVAILMGGGPKAMYACKALAAYDEFKAA